MSTVDISKLKMEDFRKELKPMVTQLEAVRSGNKGKAIEVSLE